MASRIDTSTINTQPVERKFAPLEKKSASVSVIAVLLFLLVLLLAIKKIFSIREKELQEKETWHHVRQLCREKNMDAETINKLIQVLKSEKIRNPDRALVSSQVFEATVLPSLLSTAGEALCGAVYNMLFMKEIPPVADLLPGKNPHKKKGLTLKDLLPEPEVIHKVGMATEKEKGERGIHPAISKERASSHTPREEAVEYMSAPAARQKINDADDLMVTDSGVEPQGTAELLHAGSELRVRLPGNPDFHLCPVLHSTWEGFTIALPDSLRGLINPRIEEAVSCHIAVNDACFHFETRILDLVGGGFHICRLSHTTGIMKIQRRNFIRMELNLPLHFFHFTDDLFANNRDRKNQQESSERVMRKGILIDLSLEGCALRPIGNTSDIEIGHFLRFQITMQDEKSPLSLFGRILRFSRPDEKKKQLAHITFVGQDEHTRERLAHLLSVLKRQNDNQGGAA